MSDQVDPVVRPRAAANRIACAMVAHGERTTVYLEDGQPVADLDASLT